MKTYVFDLFRRIKKYSKGLDDIAILTDQHWVVFDENQNTKTVFIFRRNNQLLISKNGIVEKGNWDYLGNSALLLELKDASYLLKHGFFDDTVLGLMMDGKDEYSILINESKCIGELNSLSRIENFLERKYPLEEEIFIPVEEITKGTKEEKKIELLNAVPKAPVYFENEKEECSEGYSYYYKIQIQFSSGEGGNLLFGPVSKKYFLNLFNDKVYFDSKEEAIRALYASIKSNLL